MIPAEYLNFLTASTQASAALIGLLFVSISLAPEKVFGPNSEAGRQALALNAFTALANAFFISFGSLIPSVPLGLFLMVPGTVALSQTLYLLRLWSAWHRQKALVRSATLLVLSTIVYGSEIVVGIQLWRSPGDTGALQALLELLLFTYAIGLARAWELLGASGGRGIISVAFDAVLRLISGRRSEAPAARADDKPGAGGE